ncbi:MAG: FAD-binding oxidoreductase [Myxococcales bacterium]
MSAPAPAGRGRALARDLSALLGDDHASCAPPHLEAASRDQWARALLWAQAGVVRHPPEVVAWPGSTAQVQAVVRYAAEQRIPVVAVGGGSGVTGGAIPVQGGIALDLKRLRRPPRIELAQRFVEVDAGVTLAQLEDALGAAFATLGHLGEGDGTATVGGMLATRGAGARAGRYGKVEDRVLAIEAVDGTGTLLRAVPEAAVRPDLAQLLLGSEGTLAVLTRARLRCFPRPTSVWARAVRFSSGDQGARALQEILRSGLRPALLRLHGPLEALAAGRATAAGRSLPEPLRLGFGAGGHEALRLGLRYPAVLNRLVSALPALGLLLLAFEGDGVHGDDDAAEEGEEALRVCAALDGEDLGEGPVARWEAQAARAPVDRARLFASGVFSDTVEVAALWERLPSLLAGVRQALFSRALVTAQITHCYLEGCAVAFSFQALSGLPALGESAVARDSVDEDLAEAESRYDACLSAALSAAVDAGATVSHQEGVGLARQLWMPREHGEGMRELRALKSAFDPHGILNPGKLLL